MRKLIQLFTTLLYRCRSLLLSGPPGIRILMYHKVEPTTQQGYDQLNVPPERFEEQLAILAEKFHVISLSTAINLLKTGIDDNEGKPKVVITFDDGYLDNQTHALPLLEKYELPATIFVTTEFADQTLTHPRYKKSDTTQHLTWDQIKTLANHPLITIGSHTLTHPFLSEVDREQSHEEIINSKAIIENQIEKTIHFFCYPSGNYSERELEILDQSNYLAAVTVKPGKNSIDTPRMQLRRTEVTEKDTAIELQKKLAGAYDWLHELLDKKREKRFLKQRELKAKTS